MSDSIKNNNIFNHTGINDENVDNLKPAFFTTF